jgi:hypothetical protein
MIIIKKKLLLFFLKKKQIMDGFGQNRPESIMDGLDQIVWNCGRFDPNHP